MPGGRTELEKHPGESEEWDRCPWQGQSPAGAAGLGNGRETSPLSSCKRDLSHIFLCTNNLQNGAKRR